MVELTTGGVEALLDISGGDPSFFDNIPQEQRESMRRQLEAMVVESHLPYEKASAVMSRMYSFDELLSMCAQALEEE